MEVTRSELIEMLESGTPFRLVNAGGPFRHMAARIPGSETFSSFEEVAQRVASDEPIVVYCTGGHASLHAQRWLQAHGYRHVRRYAGGLSDWDAAGLTIEGHGGLAGCTR
jgi:rhodanese-related sulfurtransferase